MVMSGPAFVVSYFVLLFSSDSATASPSSAFAKMYHVPGASWGSVTIVVPALAWPGPSAGTVRTAESRVSLPSKDPLLDTYQPVADAPAVPEPLFVVVSVTDSVPPEAASVGTDTVTVRSGPIRSRAPRVLLVSTDSGTAPSPSAFA